MAWSTVVELHERPKKMVTRAEPVDFKHRMLWYTVGWLIAGVYVGVGSGYAVGRWTNTAERALKLLSNIEGSLRTHGVILLALAMFLCFALGHYSRLTWLALILSTFYSLVTAILIFLGWFFGPIAWGAPWWYLFTGALSAALMVYAPPAGTPGLGRRRKE